MHDDFNLHKKVKECVGMYKNRNVGIIMDNNGMAILQVENKLRKWREYMQELFRNEQRDVLVNTIVLPLQQKK